MIKGWWNWYLKEYTRIILPTLKSIWYWGWIVVGCAVVALAYVGSAIVLAEWVN